MSHRRKRVLILDLDERVLMTLERLLEDAGCDTCTTWNVAEARRLFADDGFDVVLVGDHPPELDAEKILAELEVRHSDCKCLVLESTAQEADLERFQSVGAFAVVTKQDLSQVVGRLSGHLSPMAVQFSANLQKIAS
jgi:DNA-binding NtrC family response regulator